MPWVQAFAAFVPDDLRDGAAIRRLQSLLAVASRWERKYKSFHIVRSAHDLMKTAGCHALLTAEGIGAAGTVEVVEQLRMQYVHAATLTWNDDNAWASGCFGSSDGLTAVGFEALARMQAVGMTVDVSHLNTRGFWDVVRHSQRPIIASHSNAAAITPHPRNLSDLQFCAVRDTGGVVGLNFYRPHLTGSSQEAFLPAFRRHLEHFLSLDGADTVCIGTDFDGMDCPPSWNGMSFIQEAYHYLLSCGYDTALLDKVFYSNAMRFFTDAIA